MAKKIICEECNLDITNENKYNVKRLGIKDYVCQKCYTKKLDKLKKSELKKKSN